MVDCFNEMQVFGFKVTCSERDILNSKNFLLRIFYLTELIGFEELQGYLVEIK